MFNSQQINESSFAYYARLGRVQRYIELHLSENITLEQAARIAGLERTSFSKFFHAKVGVCFRDWLGYQRVSQAQEFLRMSNRSITEVALDVGFQNLRSFERAFQRCTDRCPREFKKEVRPS